MGQSTKYWSIIQTLGFPCPIHTNPADHVLDVITPTAFTPEGIKEAQDNAEQLVSHYQPTETVIDKPKKGKVPIITAKKAPWPMQFIFLTQRSIRNNLRARLQLGAQIVQNYCLCIFDWRSILANWN